MTRAIDHSARSVTAADPVVPADADVQVVPSHQPAEQRDHTVRCAACDGGITSPGLAIATDGRHQHTFRNPAGYSWTVVCFRDAPGCRSSGEPTTEASWFTGYAWRLAHCRQCGRHLGWWFIATSAISASASISSSTPTTGGGPQIGVGVSSFVGLIVTRLR
jgi:hypothetical protein